MASVNFCWNHWYFVFGFRSQSDPRVQNGLLNRFSSSPTQTRHSITGVMAAPNHRPPLRSCPENLDSPPLSSKRGATQFVRLSIKSLMLHRFSPRGQSTRSLLPSPAPLRRAIRAVIRRNDTTAHHSSVPLNCKAKYDRYGRTFD